MTERLRHRGPDSSGYWEGPGVSLGMRRLAIIDVAGGEQPVFNEDRTVAVIFNGEIYNHGELRVALKRAGHRFSTDHSDTEVLVHLYEDRGLEFLKELNGMFAIALWDARQQRLVLARDRVGIKPLYYASTPGGIAFGSEPKSLLQHPAISNQPNLQALSRFFILKHVPAPMSAFAAISQLQAGHMLVVDRDKEPRLQRWWQPRFGQRNGKIDEVETKREVRRLLEDSVRLQMQSDVPFGAFLSGGLDSSTVVALMATLSTERIKTFTLVYDEDAPEKALERSFAKKIAERVGSEHHECHLHRNDLLEHIDAIVRSFDEPFSGVISSFFLSRLVSKHVKVALSGDGADELCGSYAAHRAAQPFAMLSENQGKIDTTVRQAPWLRNRSGCDLEHMAALTAQGDETDWRMAFYIADDPTARRLFSADMRKAVAETSTIDYVRDLFASSNTDDPLNRVLAVDFYSLLPDQVLAFADRLSMAHSLEVRPPFLDHRLVEYIAALPGDIKIHEGREKHILKEAVADLLPADLLDQPKQGFIMPINDWLLRDFRGYVEAVLSPERLARQPVVDAAAVADLLRAHYHGGRNLGNRIWNLLTFQLWWEHYIA